MNTSICQNPSIESVIHAFSGSQFAAKKDSQFYNDKPGSVISVSKGAIHLGYIRIEGNKVNLFDIRPYRVQDIRDQLKRFNCVIEKVTPLLNYSELQQKYGFSEVQDAIEDIAREDWDI